MTETEWLAPNQAGLRLGVSAERVRQLERTGQLPCLRTPLGRLFSREQVERLAAERERLATAWARSAEIEAGPWADGA